MTNKAVCIQFALTFIFFDELFCSRKSNLGDILLDFLLAHAHTVVNNGECLCLFVNLYIYGAVSKLSFELSQRGKCL